MSMEVRIQEKLAKAFSPVELEVLNESDQHAHHASSPGTGESHFRVRIIAEVFENKNRLERHRMVNEVLSEELAGPVHALAISAHSPSEV